MAGLFYDSSPTCLTFNPVPKHLTSIMNCFITELGINLQQVTWCLGDGVCDHVFLFNINRVEYTVYFKERIAIANN